jgi:hypothetical protein
VDTFDALELDVAGGARAGDQREGAAGAVQRADRLGNARDDPCALDDTDVQVGHERERAAAGVLAAVEDDGAGLGDGQRAAGERAVEGVEVADAQAVAR